MSENQTEKPTRIMYKSNLGWARLQGHLRQMKEKGLIETVPSITSGRGRGDRRSPSIYKITKKGFIVLRIVDMLYEYVEAPPPVVNIPPAVLRLLAKASGYGAASFESTLLKLLPESLVEEHKGQEEESSIVDEALRELTEAVVIVEPRTSGVVDELSERLIEEWPEQPEPKVIEVEYIVVTETTIDGAFLCPIDGCSFRSYSEPGIKRHVKKKHGKKARVAVIIEE